MPIPYCPLPPRPLPADVEQAQATDFPVKGARDVLPTGADIAQLAVRQILDILSWKAGGNLCLPKPLKHRVQAVRLDISKPQSDVCHGNFRFIRISNPV
ncbi:hypothetical protein [Mesorhizobium sp.]|uniref:hypothetical protein n=1 Tax=Mesorhizobium sp. TaxID=1871066 RepID=UPI003BABC88C